MDKKVLGAIAAVVAIVLVVLFARSTKESRTGENLYIMAGPIKLKYNPKLKPGVIAALEGREISEADLLNNSKLLEELAGIETNLVLEAIEKKLGGKASPGTKIELFRPKPSANFVPKLAGTSGVEVTFSARQGGDYIAKVNGDFVTRKDLPLNQVRYSEVLQGEMDEYLNLLKGLFMRQLLLHKAKEASTDIEGLIKANIIKQDIVVTDEDLARFAKENNIPANLKDKMIAARLKSIIIDRRRNEAIDEYAKVQFQKNVGEISLKGPDFVVPISENQALIEQKSGSGGTVVYVFGNMLCNNCSTLISDLMSLRDEFKGGVRVGFIHLFSDGDWKSRLLAESAQCLSAQKYDYFWTFASSASKEGETIDEKRIYELVKLTGADFPKFQTCLLKQNFKQTVDEHLKYANDLGVTRAPTVIIGDHILSGGAPKQKLTDIVREQASVSKAGHWFK